MTVCMTGMSNSSSEWDSGGASVLGVSRAVRERGAGVAVVVPLLPARGQPRLPSWDQGPEPPLTP